MILYRYTAVSHYLDLENYLMNVNAIVADQLQVGVFDFCLETTTPIAEVIKSFNKHAIQVIQGPVLNIDLKDQ